MEGKSFNELDLIYGEVLNYFEDSLSETEVKDKIAKYKNEDGIKGTKQEKRWEETLIINSSYLFVIKLFLLKIIVKEGLGSFYQLKSYSLNEMIKKISKVKDNLIAIDGRWELLSFDRDIEDIFARIKEIEFNLESSSLGNIYQNLTSHQLKRQVGRFYTPESVVDYILESTLKKVEIVDDPWLKLLDPSCGSGYFLSKAYDILFEKYMNALDRLKLRHPEVRWEKSYIHSHILANNLYGVDTDSFALGLTTIGLLFKDIQGDLKGLNLIVGDTLKIDLEEDFDFIIGNPPYIGHKELKKDYKRWLKDNYSVYEDKADLSYCFLEMGLSNLKKDGTLMVITSRYFLESPTGRSLRSYLKSRARIESILDFYGLQLFDGVIVDPIIIKLSLGDGVYNNIDSIRLNSNASSLKGEEVIGAISSGEDKEYYRRYWVAQNSLKSEGWRLLSKDEMLIIDKLEIQGQHYLGDICESAQGIITGHDKAFIISKEELRVHKLEEELIRPWIKNSDISSYLIESSNKYLIYSDKIDNPDDYPNTIKYLEKFKERLAKRRESKKGFIKWYNLQWGREESKFKRRKIIYPYKATDNSFAIDSNSYYASADVYLLAIKENYKSKISLEEIVGLLNSKLYSFYFKSYGKKMSYKLYDYYPNTVLRLKLKLGSELDLIKGLVQRITRLKDQLRSNCFLSLLKANPTCKNLSDIYKLYIGFVDRNLMLQVEVEDTQKVLDGWIYTLYRLDDQEIGLVEESQREGNYGLLEEGYFGADYDGLIRRRSELIKKVESNLPKEEFIRLHHKKELSLEKIGEEFGMEFQTLILLQESYLESDSKAPWRYYNLKGLREAVGIYLVELIEDLLRDKGSYLTLEEIDYSLSQDEVSSTLLALISKDGGSKKALKNLIFANKYTWNLYKSRLEKELPLNFKFINYKDYDIGLTVWGEREHSIYFKDKI